MGVLHDAFGVVFDFYVEEFLVFVVPCLGEFVYVGFVVEEVVFDLEAYDDVEVVGDFVGFYADFAGLDFVYGVDEGVECEVLEFGCDLFYFWEGVGPVFFGASDDVFGES